MKTLACYESNAMEIIIKELTNVGILILSFLALSMTCKNQVAYILPSFSSHTYSLHVSPWLAHL